MDYPDDRKYTDHDEWILLQGDVLTLGLTDHAQDALGELVYIEMPEVGAVLAAGDAVCEVESVKAVAEVYSPVEAEVLEVNEELDGNEELVNSDPHGEGWLVKLKVLDAGPLVDLLDAAAYAAKVAEA